MQRFARFWLRIGAMILVAAGILTAWILYRHGAIQPGAIQHAIDDSPLAPIMFILLQILASLLFVPRTVLGIAAGLLFGFVWGTFWAILGAIAGAAAGFAFARWLGVRKFDIGSTPGIGRIMERAEQGGWRAVAITRLIPLPHTLVNTALAFTKLGWRDYLVGSLIGMAPMTLLQVEIGAAGGQVLTGQGNWVAGCLLLALGLGRDVPTQACRLEARLNLDRVPDNSSDILPDLLATNLKLVVCGSAAGLKSAQRGAYYAGPGNRFWKMLFRINAVPVLLTPPEFPRLLDYGIGLTDMAKRTFGADSRLVATDFDRDRLRRQMLRYRPGILAFNGKRAAAAYFGCAVDYGYRAGGDIGETRIYVGPSTSGAACRFWDESVWQHIGDVMRDS